MAGILVVFDFDKTIIDCDSDNWVIDEMGLTELFNQLLPTMPWNSVMDRMMNELHCRGRTIQEITECLKGILLHPQTIKAIKSAQALGCDLRIVSDANLFFIETILEHHGLLNCFSEIHTNPGFIDEDGKLRIRPYHDFTSSSHNCKLCPPNMCKGMVLDQILRTETMKGRKTLIYLGDGAGDFCPSLRLDTRDYVMPRQNFPLWDLICCNSSKIKAQIHEWTYGEDQERILLQLINMILTDDSDSIHSFSDDCKFQRVPISPHKIHGVHSSIQRIEFQRTSFQFSCFSQQGLRLLTSNRKPQQTRSLQGQPSTNLMSKIGVFL